MIDVRIAMGSSIVDITLCICLRGHEYASKSEDVAASFILMNFQFNAISITRI